MQIKIKSLYYKYSEANFSLDIPDLTLSPGLICLVGQKNESGKSTLLKLLADLRPLEQDRLCLSGSQ